MNTPSTPIILLIIITACSVGTFLGSFILLNQMHMALTTHQQQVEKLNQATGIIQSNTLTSKIASASILENQRTMFIYLDNIMDLLENNTSK